MSRQITTIGFDADDTLWHNENLFEAHHAKYCELLAEYHNPDTIEDKLFETEMRNLELFGYGVKSFTLSSIETAINLTDGQIKTEEIRRIIDYCKQMLDHPVDLIEGARAAVEELSINYRLVLITKGDLRDQERKIKRSGLAPFFAHTEIVSDKTQESYERLLQFQEIDPPEFLMVGNSLKSDILPVLELGGYGAHIPYRITWKHEQVDTPSSHRKFHTLENIALLPALIEQLNR